MPAPQSIANHLPMLRGMIDQALREHPVAGLRAESLAVHIQAVLQGAFIMAKARQDAEAARDSLDHLYRYVELLFGRSTSSRKATKSQR